MKPGFSIRADGGRRLPADHPPPKVGIAVQTLRGLLLDEEKLARAAKAGGITVEQLRASLESLASD